MQVFRTDRKLFWTNELKSWALIIVFATALLFGFQLFSSTKTDNLLVGIFVLFLIKIADTITQYHVTEIEIDKLRNEMIFKLYSPMSGEKIKKYELKVVRSELRHHSGITKLLSSAVTLNLLLTPKDMFRINSRYGFSSKSQDYILKPALRQTYVVGSLTER